MVKWQPILTRQKVAPVAEQRRKPRHEHRDHDLSLCPFVDIGDTLHRNRSQVALCEKEHLGGRTYFVCIGCSPDLTL